MWFAGRRLPSAAKGESLETQPGFPYPTIEIMNTITVKIFVNTASKIDLETLIKNLNFQNDHSFEVDIVKNSDFNASKSKEFPDGFLFFPLLVEYYSGGKSETADISNTTVILEELWRNNIPAVASCDYEDKLPENGGYKCKNIPWIK
jgi:hypothetical protein